ncbi:MAG TPA: hypothetical protein VHA53_09760, partial [Nitrolancea sp.]|nr:hypothetical protein [Nitrolancea sp.]
MARVATQRQSAQLRTAPAMILAFLRRIRAERPQAGAIVAMVLVTSLVFATVPRLFNQMSDDGIRYAIRNSPVYAHNIVMTRGSHIEPGTDGNIFQPVIDEGDQFRQSLAPSIQSVIGHTNFMIDSVRYQVFDPNAAANGFYRFITLRYQNQIDQHITLVQGRMPAHTSDMISVLGSIGNPDVKVPVIEIALSQKTADALNIKLGDTVRMTPDNDDRLISRINGGAPNALAYRLVGIIALQNPDDDYWYSVPAFDPP